MIENKIDKQIDNQTKNLEIEEITKALYLEKCKRERLRNEHNSLKVDNKNVVFTQFCFMY